MPNRHIATLLAGMGLSCALSPAAAHEFWVAPLDYTPDPGARIVAALEVGQMMKGADFPFLSHRFQSLTVTTREGTQDVEGTEGDSPALSLAAAEPGLYVIALHAAPAELTFDTFAEFAEYLDYEGLGEIADAHRARSLPERGFAESYTRCAKALVQVGPVTAADNDTSTGLPFELIAEENPYADGIEMLPVRLTWQGTPVAGRQIAVFRDNGTVTRSLVTTDGEGRALVPLAGGGEFLLNAVNMEPVERGEIVWASHWASLTFGLPLAE